MEGLPVATTIIDSAPFVIVPSKGKDQGWLTPLSPAVSTWLTDTSVAYRLFRKACAQHLLIAVRYQVWALRRAPWLPSRGTNHCRPHVHARSPTVSWKAVAIAGLHHHEYYSKFGERSEFLVSHLQLPSYLPAGWSDTRYLPLTR
jgi:hypothetical protein